VVMRRCLICDRLEAELVESDHPRRYQCRHCGAVFTDGFRRLVEDMEVSS
jgi:hypothetical protein